MERHSGVLLSHNETGRSRVRRLLSWGIVGTAFLVAAVVLTILLTSNLGAAALLLAAAVSTTVIGIAVPLFLWVDRLEAEPARMLWFAFLWGALIATTTSIVMSLLAVGVLARLGFDSDMVAAVGVAPIVEEATKGAGVLILFLFARREFNGVVDGIVYAGLIAIGFAFVEDIIYLAQSYETLGNEGLIAVFVLRCLVTPFAHPMFTVCFGISLGLLTHRRRWRFAWIPVLGFLCAISGHALWNAATGTDVWIVLYLVVQVPLFLGFLGILSWARRAEARMIREHLTRYGLNGWFTPAEVSMLTSTARRRRARQWAKASGGQRAVDSMRSFQDVSAELAITREHLERGGRHEWWTAREGHLLTAASQRRAELTSVQ